MSQFCVYSEIEEKFIETSVHYFVAQVQRKKLKLALDLSRHQHKVTQLSMLMDINLKSIYSALTERLFDSCIVKSYSVTRLDGVEQEAKRFGRHTVSKWWRNKMIISTTHAKSYEAALEAEGGGAWSSTLKCKDGGTVESLTYT